MKETLLYINPQSIAKPDYQVTDKFSAKICLQYRLMECAVFNVNNKRSFYAVDKPIYLDPPDALMYQTLCCSVLAAYRGVLLKNPRNRKLLPKFNSPL